MEKRSRGDRGNRSDQILVVWLEVNLQNKEFLKTEFLIFDTAFLGGTTNHIPNNLIKSLE